MTLEASLDHEFGGTWTQQADGRFKGSFSPTGGALLCAFFTQYLIGVHASADHASLTLDADEAFRSLKQVGEFRARISLTDTITEILHTNPSQLLVAERHIHPDEPQGPIR